MKTIHSRTISFFICLIVYVTALAVVVFCIRNSEGILNSLWTMLIADIVATVVVFIFSVIFNNSSLYDPYWSVAPPLITFYWIKNGFNNLAAYLMLFAIMFWAIRLTLNWARGWQGLAHEDWRYKMLHDKNPKLYPITNFFGIHLFPTIMVFLGLLPVYFITSQTTIQTVCIPVLIVGLILSLAATIIQLVADEQMRSFKIKAKPGQYINTGIWKYSRHPNYFGEILFWTGLWVMQMAVAPVYWWTSIGFVAMLSMFLFASIPMMEERNRKSKVGYEEYVKKVSALIPWYVTK